MSPQTDPSGIFEKCEWVATNPISLASDCSKTIVQRPTLEAVPRGSPFRLELQSEVTVTL